MGVVAATAEAVPVPPTRRRAAVMMAVAALFSSAAITAHKVDMAADPGHDLAPAVSGMWTPPIPASRQVAAYDSSESDDDDILLNVPVPSGLLLRLRAAHAGGHLDLFEDVAHELALHLL